MNAYENAVLDVARQYFSHSEVEKMAGLIQLRNSKNASVRAGANRELMIMLNKLESLVNPPRTPLKAV